MRGGSGGLTGPRLSVLMRRIQDLQSNYQYRTTAGTKSTRLTASECLSAAPSFGCAFAAKALDSAEGLGLAETSEGFGLAAGAVGFGLALGAVAPGLGVTVPGRGEAGPGFGVTAPSFGAAPTFGVGEVDFGLGFLAFGGVVALGPGLALDLGRGLSGGVALCAALEATFGRVALGLTGSVLKMLSRSGMPIEMPSPALLRLVSGCEVWHLAKF